MNEQSMVCIYEARSIKWNLSSLKAGYTGLVKLHNSRDENTVLLKILFVISFKTTQISSLILIIFALLHDVFYKVFKVLKYL
jgi:hypothetical protein